MVETVPAITTPEEDRQEMPPRRSSVLGVSYDNTTSARALDTIVRHLESAEVPAKTVVFVNVRTVWLARSDPDFRRIVNTADLVLPDGSGLAIASWINGALIKENLNGTDFTPRVLEQAASAGRTVYLLGAREDVVARCHEHIRRAYPGINVVGSHPGFFDPEAEDEIVKHINLAGPDLLLVGMGSPVQERWVARHAHRLNVRVCMSVGGLFDFLSGEVPRAPMWLRRIGLEFVFRFLRDPRGKSRRLFLEIPGFLFLVIVDFLRRGRRPSAGEVDAQHS